MINHCRTLLGNLSAAALAAAPGSEYVPPEFTPLTLSTPLAELRRLLFGATPDAAGVSLRLQQYLNLLCASELAEYLTVFDARLTTDPEDTEFAAAETWLPVVEQTAGTPAELTLTGQPHSPDATGRLGYGHVVRIDGGNVIVTSQFDNYQATTAFVLTDDLGPELPLGHTGYLFRLRSAEDEASWTVRGYLRPQRELGSLLLQTRGSLGEPLLLWLFGPQPVEPYLTFSNLWRDHTELPYALGGFLLAVIWRLEELRNGQGH